MDDTVRGNDTSTTFEGNDKFIALNHFKNRELSVQVEHKKKKKKAM